VGVDGRQRHAGQRAEVRIRPESAVGDGSQAVPGET
jgi:hypothetical protein